jgi:hypothetical protein
MKKLINFLKQLWIFISCLNPKVKERIYYEKALDNMKETRIISTLEKRILKSQIRFFVNNTIKRARLTPYHMAQLVDHKFGEEMETAGLKFTSNYTVIDA